MYAVRTRNCRDCGIEITGPYPPTKPVGCVPCNIERAIKAAREMAAKDGPAYDKWRESRGPSGRPRNVTLGGNNGEAG